MDASIEHAGGEPTVVEKTADFVDLLDVKSRIEMLYGRTNPAINEMEELIDRLRAKTIDIDTSFVELKSFKKDLQSFLQYAESVNMVFDESNDFISKVVENPLEGVRIDVRLVEELLFKIEELITEKEKEKVIKGLEQQKEEEASSDAVDEESVEDQRKNAIELQKVKVAETQERCGKIYSERITYLGGEMFLLWNRLIGNTKKMGEEKNLLVEVIQKIGKLTMRNTPNICVLKSGTISIDYKPDADFMIWVEEYLDDLRKILNKVKTSEFKELLETYITDVENLFISVNDLFNEEPQEPEEISGEPEGVVEEQKSKFEFKVSDFKRKVDGIMDDFKAVRGENYKLGRVPEYMQVCDTLGLSLSEENRIIKEYEARDDLLDPVKLSIRRSFANSRNLVIRMLGTYFRGGDDLLKRVESFKDKMRMVVVVESLTVPKILKSGRIKSGFEEGANAVLSHNSRSETEEEMGWADKHPVYGGVLGIDQSIRDYGLKSYGPCEIRLVMDNFREHSTYLLGDSIGADGLPDLFKPGYERGDIFKKRKYETGDMKGYRGISERQFCFLHLPIVMVAADKIQSSSQNKSHVYLEAQIGKSPKISDMKEVVLHKNKLDKYKLHNLGFYHIDDFIEFIKKQVEGAGVKFTVLE